MSDVAKAPIASAIYNILRAIPVLGYAMRCIEERRETEFYVLSFVLFEALVVAVLMFGFPALITFALAATALAFIAVLLATRG